jgi:hypothetical protein
MFHSRMAIAAALLAFGALFTTPALAGGKNGGCGGNCGGGGGGFSERIICVVNGRRFEVSDVRNCYPRRKFTYGYVRYHFEGHVGVRRHIRIARHLPVCGCADAQSGYAGYGASYSGYGYDTGGSVAAQMQAERRARNAAMTDGGVYFGQDDGSFEQPRRYLKKRRHFIYGGYDEGYTYDPGYVIHYGPVISKDGGY